MTTKMYTKQYKESIIKQLLPPMNKTIPRLSREENIPRSTFHNWVRKAREKGVLIPNTNASSQDEKWRKEDKFRMVVETYTLNEEEIGQYCRRKGMYRSDLKR